MGDWTKLLAIQALLPLSKWVMLLDADAIIVDHSTQFDTIIQAAKTINSNAEVVISNCKECSRNNPDFDPLLSINVGVMFVHNSQWSHEWINKLYMMLLHPTLLEFEPDAGAPLPGNTNPYHDNWAIYMWFLTEQHSKTKKRVVLMDH